MMVLVLIKISKAVIKDSWLKQLKWTLVGLRFKQIKGYKAVCRFAGMFREPQLEDGQVHERSGGKRHGPHAYRDQLASVMLRLWRRLRCCNLCHWMWAWHCPRNKFLTVTSVYFFGHHFFYAKISRSRFVIGQALVIC